MRIHDLFALSALLALPLLAQEPGPAVGTMLPDFSLPDQEGKAQTFASLRGPKGLVLVFSRSADW